MGVDVLRVDVLGVDVLKLDVMALPHNIITLGHKIFFTDQWKH